jgi:hypothetical protein
MTNDQALVRLLAFLSEHPGYTFVLHGTDDGDWYALLSDGDGEDEGVGETFGEAVEALLGAVEGS